MKNIRGMQTKYTVIFDGVCVLCNHATQFIIKHDPEAIFVFAPMQGRYAKKLIAQFEVQESPNDTFILLKNGSYFCYSDAALEIAKDLTAPWSWLALLRIIPRPIRDFFYIRIARNRYRLFGKHPKCMVPSDTLRSRFVD